MSEWLERIADWASYRPSDFLMFAPRTYWRLFELNNERWWPLPLGCLAAAALAWVGLVRESGAVPRGAPGSAQRPLLAMRAGFVALAAAWGFVGVTFVHGLYGEINWAARSWAWAFGLEAVLLLGVAAAVRFEAPAASARWAGLALTGWAVFGQPLLAPWAGRGWAGSEMVGLTPDATIIATLGVLLVLRPAAARPPMASAPPASWWAPRGSWARWAWRLAWFVAALCAAASAATLAVMQAGEAVWPTLALGLAVLASLRRRAR